MYHRSFGRPQSGGPTPRTRCSHPFCVRSSRCRPIIFGRIRSCDLTLASTAVLSSYHLVWSTKYRYKALTGALQLRVRDTCRQMCR
ncbi:transposase [Primorskyibacter marinus]|uniref:transposase n=1 Tax=Primorskyibacter marinus TaxID=1977320 RepID=UPI000E30A026